MFLNIDLGELDDEPEALYQLADVANIALGGHAGNEASIARAIARCRAFGTAIGAHPSYPDREGFGRRRLALDGAALAASVAEQCARLPEAVYLKPHGALYHAADADRAIAEAVLDGASLLDEPMIIGPAGGAFEAAARARGLRYAREGFADRAGRETQPGRFELVPRDRPGAVLGIDAARAQAAALVRAARIDTLCVHGDSPDAVAIALEVRTILDESRS